ncbi:MAG: amidase [Solirubrobacterales bacterium]|nr:amidase [Solirubrobacterales bacterium]
MIAVPTSIDEIARAVQARELDPVETVERALRAIEAHADLNAFITVCSDEALARARAGVSGTLAGVPLLVKDVFDTAGIRTTAGSRIHGERVPRVSARAVLALEAVGAIVIGKTNCDEFAWGVTGQNAFYGDVGNPTRPGRIAGGSSSGNAAALAASIAPLALGSDTGGSVRMPAACCEVVGMKPRLGALATDGLFPLCPSFDTPGPMARSVAECARCYEVLAGAALREHEPRGLHVGVLTGMPRLAPGVPAPERDERALAFAARLENLGITCEEVALPIPEANVWPVFYGEAAATHRDTFPARRDDYGPTVRAKLEDAQHVTLLEREAARRALAAWRGRAQREPHVDAIVSPTLGVLEVPPADVDELEIRVPFSAYTRAFSFLGWPAIAIGEVQFAAREPGLLFTVALAWERSASRASQP